MDTATDTGYPPAWTPEPGETVEGPIVKFDAAPTKFSNGQDVPIVTVEDISRGPVSMWLTRTVLRQKVARLRPKAGETLRITYVGEREGASGSYHDYHADCPDRPPYVPDWDKLNDEPEEPSE